MKPNTLILTLSIGLLTTTLFGQTPEYKQYLLKQRLPDIFRSIVVSQLDNQYELSDFMNPFYLLADFNGDKKTDIVVTVEEIKTGKTGFIIFHIDTDDFYVIGAGNSIGNGGDNFQWLDIWKVYTKDIIEPGVGETKRVELTADAIFVEKAESASAVIYWTGKEYKWYQQGD
ncbi:hypothetical protein JYT51_02065 [Candidatus Amoebophilus asiaticus]|nr:hypothetical protein [Candidatus Amoebophilus asiaticus]